MTEPKPQNKIMYYLGEFWKNQTYLAIVFILTVGLNKLANSSSVTNVAGVLGRGR